MKETKFTPRPWKAITFTLHTGEETVRIVPTDAYGIIRGPGPICEVFSQKVGILDEACIANAHLIAAAPEMLEALENALATCEHDMQHILDNGRLRSVLRAAISKAKGEGNVTN